jgi:protein-L-isoaspartate O-methyltransferase
MRDAEQLEYGNASGTRGASASLAAAPDFWKDYYQQIQCAGTPWLDCSNERTHLQTIAVALEAAGSAIGRRTLEIGCGRGHLSRCLAVLESAECVALDQVSSLFDGHERRYPEVTWICGDAGDRRTLQSLGSFDLIFLVEVLQYLPIADTLLRVTKQLAPGGRLVAIVPNAECPIIQKAAARFNGHYVPADVGEVKRTFESAPTVDWWACRGMTFADDQRVVPYALSPWTDDPNWPAPPNRLVLVAQAKSAQ